MKRRKTALMLIFVMLFTNCISVFGDVKQDILDIKTSKYDYDGNGVVDIFDLCIFKYDLLHEGDDIVPPEPGTEPTGEVTTEPGTEPTGEVTTEPGTEPTGEVTTEPTTEPTAEVTTEPTSEPTPEPTTEPVTTESGQYARNPAMIVSEQPEAITGEVRANLSAQDFVKEMKAGWNLGNTFDAWQDTGSESSSYSNYFNEYIRAIKTGDYFVDPGTFELDPSVSEILWHGHYTSKAMFEAVKAKGFDFVRIPTTWRTHMDSEYNIDPYWLNRVQQVVNWALECDLKVILNSHHDEEAFDLVNSANRAKSEQFLSSLWTQVAERFIEYGDDLIFEVLNEPRTVGGPNEWGGNASEVAVLNAYEQLCVDTIRATGGNNANRFLLVPTYSAASYGAALTSFVKPTDSAADKIIIEIHAYNPWSLAGSYNENGSTTEFDQRAKDEIDGQWGGLTAVYDKFVSQGTPVILDEFGFRTDKADAIGHETRNAWMEYYVAAARRMGMPVCLWDDGGWFNSLNRDSLTWYDDEYIDILTR